MAKPKTNHIIKEGAGPNLLQVWTPTPVEAKALIEAIEGVVRVHHCTDGYLNVWLNLCYSKAEVEAEIKAALSEQRTGWVVGGKVFTEPKIKDQLKPRPPGMPHWFEIRPLGWKYMGWIKRPSATSTFEDLVANACQSDHGEIRGVDVYPEGAACWMKEQS